MDSILAGIYSRYIGDAPLKAATPGGLHIEMAPPGVKGPFVTMNVISGRPEYMFRGTAYEIVTIQFDIYAATNALRLTAYNALTALYDDARPTATAVIMERVLNQLVRDGSQQEIFRAVVTYDCRFLKS